MLKPVERMWDICENSKLDSDIAYFHRLMLLGEMVAKITVASLIACIRDDKERSRYSVLYELVRASSLGGWSQALDSVLALPGHQYVHGALSHRKQLQERVGSPSWQFESVAALRECLHGLSGTTDSKETTVQAKQWLKDFVYLRNRTRGHGATPDYKLAEFCEPLSRSIKLFTRNYGAFNCEWAHLRSSLSGKYKIASLSSTSSQFQKAYMPSNTLSDGVYVFLDEPHLVELIHVDLDPTDIYISNGNFKNVGFECLSYISDNLLIADSRGFVDPPQRLPRSETEGNIHLGLDLSNLPEPPSDYVSRQDLERELGDLLVDDYPRIVTLRGRGGIGKTSLALSVLKDLAKATPGRFDCILWFSARDIDLLPEGPRRVHQDVLDEGDIAAAFARLVGPLIDDEKEKKAIDLLAEGLQGGQGMPICCFVLDNLETVRDPQALYRWLYTYIRPPNKLLITTRQSGFKEDWPLTIPGMSWSEFNDLVDKVGGRLGVLHTIGDKYREDVYQESGGHPYVVKILLGEIRKAGGARSLQRVMASEDAILEALFERTFGSLSLAAQRTFLTLSSWRSVVPRVAVEAVLLRPSNDFMRVGEALDELAEASMIETLESGSDKQRFISTPVAAALFGRRQLLVSTMKTKVDEDVALLREFGTGDLNAVKRGIGPHIQRFAQFVAKGIIQFSESHDSEEHPLLRDYVAILEYIGRQHAGTWLVLAQLYDEVMPDRYRPESQGFLRRYLMVTQDSSDKCGVWRQLAFSYRRSGNISGELHALNEMCKSSFVRYDQVSEAADQLNSAWATHRWNSERIEMARTLVETLQRRVSEARPNDYSRIAWLCVHLNDLRQASRVVLDGLALDPSNEHLSRLASRLGIRGAAVRR